MKYRPLGASGLEISGIGLGCMGFGDAAGIQKWSIPEDASLAILRQAIEAGINLFDTSNAYSDGRSEQILGNAIRKFSSREDVVLATKLFHPTRLGPNRAGLSRISIMREVETSLRNLGTDYIDLYQIHRWDDATPIEETLQSLDDLVRTGKVRYLGASSMWTWQFSHAQHIAERNGWTKFISMQDQYSLLYREEEREMHPYCSFAGVGVIPWSPLARGRLTRAPGTVTSRSTQDPYGRHLDRSSDQEVVERVFAVAEQRCVKPAHVALAWVASKPIVAAPIVGATKPGHLDDALVALDIKLTDDEVAFLEAPYESRQPEEFQ